MTLDEAVAVLNRERHRGCDEWRTEPEYHSTDPGGEHLCVVGEYRQEDHFSTFEAIAIAKEYERMQGGLPVPERFREALVGYDRTPYIPDP